MRVSLMPNRAQRCTMAIAQADWEYCLTERNNQMLLGTSMELGTCGG
jgi:hypothetical protein